MNRPVKIAVTIVVVLLLIGVLVKFAIDYASSLPVETRQANVYAISGCDGNQVMDVVFLHGVDGDYQSTWQAPGIQGESWLNWLAATKPGTAVWAIDYPVATTKLRGQTMDLTARSRNLISRMINKKFAEHPKRPLVFVCHSFGGLVAKKIIQAAANSNDSDWQIIGGRVKGVVFIATPHRGSDFKTFWRHVFGKLTTVTEAELRAGNELVLDLGRWYRDHSPDMDIKTLCFAEGHKIAGEYVVPPESADADIKDSEIEKIDANHINICKLTSKDQQVFESTLQLIQKVTRRQPMLKYPDPTTSNWKCRVPTAVEASSEALHPAQGIVLHYQNQTSKNIELVLFDWNRYYADKGLLAWTHLKTEQSSDESHYQDFESDRKGWFSVFVQTPNGSLTDCLGTVNLFATLEPRIVIKLSNGKYEMEIR